MPRTAIPTDMKIVLVFNLVFGIPVESCGSKYLNTTLENIIKTA